MSKKLSAKNKVVVASAGSRKTTMVVEEALELAGKRILVTTYTNENLDQIRSYFIERCGHVPKHVTLLSWFTFLLQDGVRPYQSFVTSRRRIDAILFEELPDRVRYTPKSDTDKYFLAGDGYIYRDRVSDFVCTSDDHTGGLVIKRLEKVYDHMFVDEMQDLAGYDFAFLEKLFGSVLPVTAVGDPRQGTYSTNNSGKNKKFKRGGILEWIQGHQKAGNITVAEKNECHRAAVHRVAGYGNTVVKKNKNARVRLHIEKIINRYQPDVMALHNVNAKGTYRHHRIKELHKQVIALARKRKVRAVKFSNTELRNALLGNEHGTKHEMAELLAKRFPDELASRLPEKRKDWTSEDAHMDIFDAVGLAEVLQMRQRAANSSLVN